jgi:O-acetyl-ADP-ribose deacetylase (regulator of RNase III)
MALKYRLGDATQPYGNDNKVLVHICNDVGAWGKGFVVAISRRWPEPERQYRRWYRRRFITNHNHEGELEQPFQLGAVDYVKVEADLWVANLLGQRGLRPVKKRPPIRYNAVRKGLLNIADFASENQASVHMPRIGSGLAGGNWATIEQIIYQTLAPSGIEVTVYDLPKRS